MRVWVFIAALFTVGLVAAMVAFRANKYTVVASATEPKDHVSNLIDAYGEVLNDEVMIRDNRFGISRIPSIRDGHPTVLLGNAGKSEVNRITSARAQLARAGYEHEEGLISIRPLRNFRPSKEVRKRKSSDDTHLAIWQTASTTPLFGTVTRSKAVPPDLQVLIRDSSTKLLKGGADSYTTKLNGWHFVARTVDFEKPVCASCHADAKVGEPAAIVAVAYRETAKR
jgi:hypothetical protein